MAKRLSKENQVWLSRSAKMLKTNEVMLLNLLLDRLRTQLGILGDQSPENINNNPKMLLPEQANEGLVNYLDKSTALENEVLSILSDVVSVRTTLEETIRAINVYMMQASHRKTRALEKKKSQ